MPQKRAGGWGMTRERAGTSGNLVTIKLTRSEVEEV